MNGSRHRSHQCHPLLKALALTGGTTMDPEEVLQNTKDKNNIYARELYSLAEQSLKKSLEKQTSANETIILSP
jgi:hypothetical protein